MELPNPSREAKFSGVNGDRKQSFFPVQLTTSKIGNFTRLILTFAICDGLYLHIYIHMLARTKLNKTYVRRTNSRCRRAKGTLYGREMDRDLRSAYAYIDASGKALLAICSFCSLCCTRPVFDFNLLYPPYEHRGGWGYICALPDLLFSLYFP